MHQIVSHDSTQACIEARSIIVLFHCVHRTFVVEAPLFKHDHHLAAKREARKYL